MNTLVVFAALVGVASAGYLGAPLPAATYSSYQGRISQSVHAAAPVAYAQPAVAAYAPAPVAVSSSFKNRVSQSARAYAAAPAFAPVAHAVAAPAFAAPLAAPAIAAPAFAAPVAAGHHVTAFGYNGAIAGSLLG